MRPAKLAILVIAVAVVASCRDPVLDDRIDALGKETSGIPVGEFHRAGQPCTACHVEGGPAKKSFTMAGTVFAQPNRLVGVGSAEIRLTDSNGSKHLVKTNCVGNFLVRPTSDDAANGWDPAFPVLVEVEKSNIRRRMNTTIGRETSCGGCHVGTLAPGDPLSQVPHIYLFGSDEPGFPNGQTDCGGNCGGGPCIDPRAPGDPATTP